MVAIRVRVGQRNSNQKIETIFNKSIISIGRAPDSDVILKQPSISKLHCQVIAAGGKVFIHDTESRNGTYIQDARVTKPLSIEPSDIIAICDYRLQFALVLESKGQKQNTKSSSSYKNNKERRDTREQKRANPKTPPAPSNIKTKTPWETLGIPQGASKAVARKAYLSLLALYHPDKVDSLGPKLKEVALEMTKELNDAWAKIESGKA
jgi:predicted component of type VI protein secretion system